jgi:hypothetical protein
VTGGGGCIYHSSSLVFACTNIYSGKLESGFQLSCGADAFLTFRHFYTWLTENLKLTKQYKMSLYSLVNFKLKHVKRSLHWDFVGFIFCKLL